MTKLTPIDITLNHSTGTLTITWSNDRVCHYPIGPLRLACPCAECRGGHENMGRHNDPEQLLDLVPTRDYAIQRLEFVGHYALQIIWDDGHDSGIYTWDYLARLCPEETANA